VYILILQFIFHTRYLTLEPLMVPFDDPANYPF